MASPQGKYLYAVVPTEAVDKLELDVDGVEGAEVYPLVADKLAAVVSDIDTEKTELRPERKNLAAHSSVLRKVMDQTALLPVAFGLIAGDERELKALLAEHQDEMLEQLDSVQGKVEMGLRGTLRVSNVFQFFVEKFPELRQLRDDTFAGGEPSREAKIELGQAFADFMEQYQDACGETAVEHLQPLGRSRVNEPRTEEEVLNLAVLLPRDKMEEFSSAVEGLAPDLDEEIELQVSGPWPPYNFVDLRIESVSEEAEEGEEAR